jgi:exopolyphosphatase / guanosine-5'-triphosphate,3'-diphosphate pyrophosphatase
MWLTRAAAEDVFRTLATEPAKDRAFNPGLHPDRVGTIVAGAAILVTVMRHFALDGIWVSESDLLDALAASAGTV